jgi:IPT/TIG domain
MKEGQASEPSQGTPGRRALGAMESAVRRARESTGAPPLPPRKVPPHSAEEPVDDTNADDSDAGRMEAEPVAGVVPVPATPTSPPPEEIRDPEAVEPRYERVAVFGPDPGEAAHQHASTAGGEGGNPASGRTERWLVGSVIAAAVLVVTAAVALAASLTSNTSPSPPPPTVAAPAQGQAGHATGGSTSGHAGTTRPSTSRHTPSTTVPQGPDTTSTVPATPGAPPMIAALSPTSGGAGQGVVVAGSNFLSSNGQIVATFNGQVAPTSCPAQNTCTVTVPPITGVASAQVVITTASGTSNPVTFTYS